MSEEFWKHEEELDKKFDKDLFKDLDKLYDEKEELHCDEKCVNCVGGVCVTEDWACRNKLDKKQMKFN